MLFAALCHSACIVRIPAWTVRHGVPPLQLAAGKAAVLAAASAAVLCLDAARVIAAGQPAASLWLGWRQPLGWAFILWLGTGPGALTSFLHVKVGRLGLGWTHAVPPSSSCVGSTLQQPMLACMPLQGQTLVPPTDAQIAFMSVPILSALLAAAALPGEPITPPVLFGGGLVLLAGLVAALASRGGGAGTVLRSE